MIEGLEVCRLNRTSAVNHGTMPDADYTLCGCELTSMAFDTMTAQCDAKAEGIVTCSHCIQKVKDYSPVEFPDLGKIYVVKARGLHSQVTHYYYPLEDTPGVRNFHSRDRTCCGFLVPETKVRFWEASPDIRATCLKCLASPRVPYELKTEEAMSVFLTRGKYHRMYPTDYPISD